MRGRRARRSSARSAAPHWRTIRTICWPCRGVPTRRSPMAMRHVAAVQQGVPLRIRGASDRREAQILTVGHAGRKGSHGQGAVLLPDANRARLHGVKDSTAEKTTESEQTEQTQTEQTQTEQSAEQAQQTTTNDTAPALEPAPLRLPRPNQRHSRTSTTRTAPRHEPLAPRLSTRASRATVHNWTATMTESPANKSNTASPPFRL
mgnify:CR=1 FL=1